MAFGHDKEIQEYRNLMQPPDTFEDGFNWKTVLGAVFLGFIMMPGSMYLALVVGTGGSITEAARWVTIILFAEVARRSFKDLRMQEVYILYYMAGLALSSHFQGQGLLWNQYLVQSDYAHAMGIAQDIPTWIAPSAATIQAEGANFFTASWLPAILMVAFIMIITKIDQFGLGYAFYRITNDIEELPFPMAPVSASGITALANTRDTAQSWRWRCFSIGGVLGLLFGFMYIGIPAITGAFLTQPIQLIPIPWVDFTKSLSGTLEATPFNITFDLGLVLVGMVLPFWAVIGGVVGIIITCIANPMLYDAGILSNWRPQMDVVDTIFINNIDFYLSFGIGLTVAITLVSCLEILKPLLQAIIGQKAADGKARVSFGSRARGGWRRLVTNNVERGDFSVFIAIGLYILSSLSWIGLSCWLIPNFAEPRVLIFFLVYAFVYTPITAYATAKIEGLVGQAISIPMVKEATFILSGYRGVEIWFTPAPLHDYGRATVEFRILELTGTRVMSQIKTQLVTIPIVIVSTVIFSQLMWQMAPVPSEAYPFAQKMWDLQAKSQCLMYSATVEGGSLFMEAWKWDYFFVGMGSGVAAFVFLAALGLPTLLVFGVVRGLGQGTPAAILLELLGAMLGRYYFRRKFGDMWLKFAPVLLAGFSCGMGLMAMLAVSFTIIKKMVNPLIF
ncbi:MAG TPA: peptide transporter [Lentisphaeria bacterium]|nr:peptide transporter [Lentisphaeria bacterium]